MIVLACTARWRPASSSKAHQEWKFGKQDSKDPSTLVRMEGYQTESSRDTTSWLLSVTVWSWTGHPKSKKKQNWKVCKGNEHLLTNKSIGLPSLSTHPPHTPHGDRQVTVHTDTVLGKPSRQKCAVWLCSPHLTPSSHETLTFTEQHESGSLPPLFLAHFTWSTFSLF